MWCNCKHIQLDLSFVIQGFSDVVRWTLLQLSLWLFGLCLQDSHSPPDSPRATMYPPSRIVPDTQGNFASFVSSATSSNINNLSRAGPSSLLGEAQVAGGQKHQDRSQEQNLHPFRLAGFPILPHGNQLSQVRGLDPAFLFRSAEAVRNSSHVSPAYSALHQEQYRKNLVSSAALQSNTSSLLSSFSSPSSLANHSNPDKATMSSASRLPSSVAHPDVRNTSTSNASAVLSTTYWRDARIIAI